GNGALFSGAGVPQLFVDYLTSPGTHIQSLRGRVGLGILSLGRNAMLGTSDAPTPVSQSVYLLSVKLGLECSLLSGSQHAFEPYLGAALLPSFALTGRSSFDDGSVYFGLPVELSLGSQIGARSMGLHWDSLHLDLAINETLGSVNRSSVRGLGVSGGLRMDL